MKQCFIIVALFSCLVSLADSFLPETPIIWAATDKLPSSVVIYQTVQTNFPASVLSNAMVMGSFTPIDIKAQSKDMVSFESRKNNVLLRSLKISPTQGSVYYFKTQTSYSSIHGAPSPDDTKRLALEYLRLFGGDTNQLSSKPSSRTEQTVQTLDKKGGTVTNKAVSVRGIILNRALDGIDCTDSFLIEFGNDATVMMLKMDWKFLKPYRRVQTPSKKEIVAAIKSGKAVVLPDANGGDVPTATKDFTIVKATPVHRTIDAKPLFVPSFDFQVVADLGKTNAASFYIEYTLPDSSKP